MTPPPSCRVAASLAPANQATPGQPGQPTSNYGPAQSCAGNVLVLCWSRWRRVAKGAKAIGLKAADLLHF
jgi:hypothetical protein